MNDNQCLQLALNSNGSLERKTINKTADFNESILSLGSIDKIILFDCLNQGDPCSYRQSFNNIIDKEYCQKENISNRNNFCCFINETFYDTENKMTFINSGCIQVEKKEYEKFKYINNSNNNVSGFESFICFSKIYTQGIYMNSIFFILFFLF